MGVDRMLFYKDKAVANLGRTYHYTTPPLDVTGLKIELYATRDPREWCNLMETIVDYYEAKARSDLIDMILEDGVLTVKDE